MPEETTTSETGTIRARLALSTTTRGWDYESTVEVAVPLGSEEFSLGAGSTQQAIDDLVAGLQARLRITGAAERDRRNALDGLPKK